MRIPAVRLSVAFACLLAGLSSMHAQVLGEVTGRVADASGAALPGSDITLTNLATHVVQVTRSTSSGAFGFSQLNSGVYALAARRAGFGTEMRSGVTVTTGQTTRVDFRLKAGAEAAITVTGDVPLLQASTSDVATTLPGSAVIALPLNSRNFVQLAQLTPGVELPPGTVLPRIDGGRPRTN